jgi:hypothetical protein
MVNQIIEQGRVQNGGGIKFLPGDGSANYGKDSGTNHRANAKRSQRNRPEGPFEFTIRLFAIRNQFVDGLAGKKLVAQRSAPSVEMNSSPRNPPSLPCQMNPRHAARQQVSAMWRGYS